MEESYFVEIVYYYENFGTGISNSDSYFLFVGFDQAKTADEAMKFAEKVCDEKTNFENIPEFSGLEKTAFNIMFFPVSVKRVSEIFK